MKWFYAADGKSAGPFDSDDIHTRVRENRITPETLVWHEGMAEWKPFREVAADLPAAELEETSPVLADEPAAEIVDEDGTPLGPPARLQQLLVAGRSFSIREAFSRGWETVAHQPLLTIGSFFLCFVASLIVEQLGIIATLLSAPLLAGVYWVNLLMLRNQPATWSDLLTPAKRSFMPIVMVQLLLNIAVAALTFPFQRIQTVDFLGQKAQVPGVDFFHSPAGGMAFAAMLYLLVIYMFVLPLVIDQRLRAWEAILWSFRFTSRHFFKVLVFGLMLAVFAMAGFFIFLIGFFITVPICIAALSAAYLRMFTPDDSGAPPPPNSPAAAAPLDSPQ